MPENMGSILGIRTPKRICNNNVCRQTIEDATAEFCPFCGAAQTAVQPAASSSPGASPNLVANRTMNIAAPWAGPGSNTSNEIEFRASDRIWFMEESEPYTVRQPGTRRPVRIIEQETILFSHTDRRLSPEELLARVRHIIAEKQVPVAAYLYHARWTNDWDETRPRIIAFLKDHPYASLKMILGLDYMGNWANLQFQIGMQPDPYPKPPPPVSSPDATPMVLIVGGIIGAFVGLIMAAAGGNSRDGGAAVGFGVMLIIGGIIALIAGINMQSQETEKVGAQQKEREKYEREQFNRLLNKANMQLSRTYKIDDKRLFETAMRQVFKQVVDDIIQSGGQVVQEITGGRNEFAPSPTPAPQPAQGAAAPVPPIQTDAAQSGV